MSERVASIFAEIGLDASKFSSGSSSVLSGLNEIIDGFGGTALSAAALVTGLIAVVGWFYETGQAAEDSARAMVKVQTSIESTNSAAGKSVDDIANLSDHLARLSGVDDDVIMSAAGMLLTFKAVKGEIFDQTLLSALDMQAKGFGNLEGNIVQLGKALSSFEGYTALKRAGVDFTDEQLKMIKNFRETNDLAGYQKMILAELQSQVGGTAEAMNSASDGSALLNLEWNNLKENLGSFVLPAIRELNLALAGMIGMLNNSWTAISYVIQGLQYLQRAILAVQSLGLSEGLKALIGYFAGNANTGDVAPAQHASGGSFLIPDSYGHEGFKLGNYDTASGGERITITPAGQSPDTREVVSIGTINIGDTSQYSRHDIEDMIKGAIMEVVG